MTWGALYTIQPFGNYLVTMKMTGAQLVTALEQQWLGQPAGGIKMLQISGLSYNWSLTAAVGSKVVPGSVMVGGAPLDPTAQYTVTANNFLADGGDNFLAFKLATDKVIGGSDLDGLVGYIQQLTQPFGAPAGGRVIVVP